MGYVSGYIGDEEVDYDIIVKCKLHDDGYTADDYHHDFLIFNRLLMRNEYATQIMWWEVEDVSKILDGVLAYIMIDDRVVGYGNVCGDPFHGIPEMGMNSERLYVAVEVVSMIALDEEEPVTIDSLKAVYPEYKWDEIKSGMKVEDQDAAYFLDKLYSHCSGEDEYYDLEELLMDNGYDEKYFD